MTIAQGMQKEQESLLKQLDMLRLEDIENVLKIFGSFASFDRI